MARDRPPLAEHSFGLRTDLRRLTKQHACDAASTTYDRRQSLAQQYTMAAAIKALNAKIRSNPVSDYFCSTRKLTPEHMSDWARLKALAGL